MKWLCRITKDGGMDFGERNYPIFKSYLADNPGVVLKIAPVLPESNKQRRFLEGAVIPLVTWYQEGMDHRNHDDLRKVREWLKMEFNSEIVVVNGGPVNIAKSTKGRDQLQPFLERVVGWLIDNYAPPVEALDPECFRQWRDDVFMDGGADNYIDYLAETGVLRVTALK